MTKADQAVLVALEARVDKLEAEAEIRRLQARYMFLCDTPLPEFGVEDDAERIELILDLYTDDAVWEGVGEHYDNEFGKAVGKAQIRAHFERFWRRPQHPKLVLNAHYLTSEQIHVHADGETADGQWIHFQPWLFADGRGLVRGSRLNNLFLRLDGRWKLARTRTENVFVVPLPDNFVSDHPTASVLLRP